MTWDSLIRHGLKSFRTFRVKPPLSSRKKAESLKPASARAKTTKPPIMSTSLQTMKRIKRFLCFFFFTRAVRDSAFCSGTSAPLKEPALLQSVQTLFAITTTAIKSWKRNSTPDSMNFMPISKKTLHLTIPVS